MADIRKGTRMEIWNTLLFIDFKVAYNLVIRIQLYKVMDKLSIPWKLTKMVKATMEKTSSCIHGQTLLSQIHAMSRTD
jgi:hypothetical protein